jgi:PAS domain S-box-containing protein
MTEMDGAADPVRARRLEIGAAPDAVPTARRFAVEALAGTDHAVLAAAELVVSELVTNALLHAGPPVVVGVGVAATDDGVRVEVHDTSRALPVRPLADDAGMTGRGLAIVDALASRWGVEPLPDGKVVWAELNAQSVAAAQPGDLDHDELLAAYDDWPSGPGPAIYRVSLGDVPTDLLLAAKAHVDSVIRELVLSQSGASSGLTAALPQQLAELVHTVVTDFSEARQAIKRQALAAAERGEERTTLELSLPLEAAQAGERYLEALAEADAYARGARLLTLAAPPQHQAFRRWYVTSLVDALRRAAAGEPAVVAPSFESHLLAQIDELAELQRVSDRGARLQRVTASLAAALTVEQATRIALDEAMAELRAQRGLFVLPVGGALKAMCAVGYSEEAVEQFQERWAARVPTPTTRAYADGAPVWIETLEERAAQFPQSTAAAAGVVATCAVPLRVADHTVGVLRLSFLESRLFTEDERAFLEALAAVTAQALERISLLEEKARTADRLTRLQAVSAALARTRSLDDALDVTIAHATGMVGAKVASVSLLDDDGHTVRLLRLAPSVEVGRLASFDIDDTLPASEAIRSGRSLRVGSVAERDTRWPDVAGFDHGFEHAMLALPLRVEDSTIGAITLSFPGGAMHDEPDEAFVAAFADACAQALERARAAERAAAANDRLTVLAQASAQLATSLDVERTLASVARLVVPSVADWCVVHLLVQGELEAVAVEHVDPDRRELAWQGQRRWPERMADNGSVAQVVRSGVSMLVPDIGALPPEVVAQSWHDAEHAALLQELGLVSVIIAPLQARGRTLGTLTFIAAESGRRYSAGDVAFAEDLARRAAVAIDNASLFRQSSALAAGRFDAGRLDAGRLDAGRLDAGHVNADAAADAGRVLATANVGRFSLNLTDGSIDVDDVLAGLFEFHDADEASTLGAFLRRIHPDDVERVRVSLEAASANQGDYGVEYRAVLPSGVTRWIVVRGRVVEAREGDVVLTGVAYEAASVSDGRGELARLLETMTDAFFRLDRDWRFTYVNTQAERLLFRSRGELIGRNIWDEFPDGRGSQFEERYSYAARTGQAVAFEEFFVPLEAWFEVRAMPDAGGLSVFFRDVTARKAAELERIVAAERLALLGEAARGLVGTLDVRTVMDQVTSVVVPRLADWALVTLLDASGAVQSSYGRHRDPARAAAMARLVELYAEAMAQSPALMPVTRRGEALLWPVVGAAELSASLGDGELTAILRELGLASVVVVPLQSGTAALGVLCLAKEPDSRPFSEADRATAVDIGRRAGLALENARLYERQRTAAEVLQRSLLTPLPEPDHLQIAARYLPAGQEAQVGGDWYDGFLQPEGATVLVIGDVVGHDMNAAAAMGQLRNLLRGIAYDSSDSPCDVLIRVDHAIRGLQIDTLATAVVARLEQTDEQRTRLERTLRWSNAGHPPPFLLRGNGIVTILTTDDDMLLGFDPDSARHDHEVVLTPGDTVILFTDGLVERRDSPIEAGLARLEAALEAMAGLPLEDLCTALVEQLLPEDADDDVAIVAVRAFREDRPRPAEAGPEDVPVDVPDHG